MGNMNKMCIFCNNNLKQVLDFGMQPITTRYVTKLGDNEFKHNLTISYCIDCGLIQLGTLFPLDKVKPIYDWVVVYSEPEDHLDELATRILALKDVDSDSKFLGLSFKDDTTLRRLNDKGCKTQRIELEKYGVSGVFGLETVQSKINKDKVLMYINDYGMQDVIVARHILEHSYDIKEFLNSCNEMLNDNGYLIIEVPGCEQAINDFDYTMIWEEHTAYFTENTLKNVILKSGFKIVDFIRVNYPLEDSLLIIAKKVGYKSSNMINLFNDIKKVNSFGLQFEEKKKEWNDHFNSKNKVALFGAGHLATVFINIFELKDKISFILDDDINKKDLFMPGSNLSIKDSSHLNKNEVDVCLLSLNPRNEHKIIEKNNDFMNENKIYSIFPSSKYYALK